MENMEVWKTPHKIYLLPKCSLTKVDSDVFNADPKTGRINCCVKILPWANVHKQESINENKQIFVSKVKKSKVQSITITKIIFFFLKPIGVAFVHKTLNSKRGAITALDRILE